MKQRYAFRILSMLLALVLVFELFPTGALALETGTNEAETPTAQLPTGGGNPLGVQVIPKGREEADIQAQRPVPSGYQPAAYPSRTAWYTSS